MGLALPRVDRAFDRGRLRRRSLARQNRLTAHPPPPPFSEPRGQPRNPRTLQVLRLLRCVGCRPPDLAGAAHVREGPESAPAGRHQFLHVSNPELHDRHLPAPAQADVECARLLALRRLLPTTRRRPDRSRLDFLTPARSRATVRRGTGPLLPHSVPCRLREEGLHRRQHGHPRRSCFRRSNIELDGGALARDAPLRRSDILRLLWLQRHGDRHGWPPWIPPPRQFRPSVHRQHDDGVLATLAHQPLDLVPRLPLHSHGRLPSEDARDFC